MSQPVTITFELYTNDPAHAYGNALSAAQKHFGVNQHINIKLGTGEPHMRTNTNQFVDWVFDVTATLSPS